MSVRCGRFKVDGKDRCLIPVGSSEDTPWFVLQSSSAKKHMQTADCFLMASLNLSENCMLFEEMIIVRDFYFG